MQECKECVLPKVILYTTGCPQCKVVENKLDEHGIEYETVTDEDSGQCRCLRLETKL